MVRIMIKGGVWKNTEDEILKAAVMKYGKNQWARISSLLVRKTPKQCKARWYEWIDPSIKKTEWSREEEEKLLHLAKIMPTQWRTIAPMIGRTAAQCLEHYEKLLDSAQEKEAGAGAGAGAAGEKEDKDDPRRLKPGEIDPLPEAKPARPDPVDMDEDEKEMLSEARARLANVKGKKAKRKAREKQLEEARRLAALQKKRELKAAGIELATKKRKKKHGLDYNAEIPFHRAPVPGFYDTSAEKKITATELKKSVREFVGKSLDQLEQRNRDETEEKARKKDAEKQKLQKKVNLPAQLVAANKLNDPNVVRPRARLIMPAPQMSEDELEAVQRSALGSGAVGAAAAAALAAGSSATKALLGQYGAQTPALGGATPFGGRTPMAARTPMQKDTILMEAQNLIALNNARTPLMGGENTPLHATDFSGVTPKRAPAQTPNVLATPARGAGTAGGVGMTPARGFSAVSGTPIRDALGLNAAGEEGAMVSGGMDAAAVMRAKKAAAKRQNPVQRAVKASLMDLPAPQHGYEFSMPQLPPKPESDARELVEDAEDAAARVAAEAQAKVDDELRRRSQAVQRGLPRPFAINFDADQTHPRASASPDDALAIGHAAVREEMQRLLRHDNAKYPVPGAPDDDDDGGGGAAAMRDDDDNPRGKKKRKVIKLERYAHADLSAAKRLIDAEMNASADDRESVEYAKRHADAVAALWDRTHSDYAFVPALGRYAHVRAPPLPHSAALQALRQQFEAVRSELADEAFRAKKLEAKVEVLTAGYQMRAAKQAAAAVEAHFALSETATELECFLGLSAVESRALPLRLAAAKAEVAAQAEREKALQSRYQALTEQREQLLALLATAKRV